MAEQKEKKARANDNDRLVSKRLRIRRIMLGLSQQELGDALNVSIQQIQKYETGANRLSCGRIYSIAKFLGVPVEYFFDQYNVGLDKMSHIFAEEQSEYGSETRHVSEKEILSLVKGFNAIKDTKVRKRIIELIKAMKKSQLLT